MMPEKITFGFLNNKPITWTLCYDRQSYMSDNALLVRQMHQFGKVKKQGLKWKDSDLYNYLNTEFIEEIQAQSRRKDIIDVSLLTEGDVSIMFKTNEQRIITNLEGSACIWWLRHTEPIQENQAKYILDDGSIWNDAPVNSDGIYIRPTIQLRNICI